MANESCVVCGKPIKVLPRGRRKLYCGYDCRQSAYWSGQYRKLQAGKRAAKKLS